MCFNDMQRLEDTYYEMTFSRNVFLFMTLVVIMMNSTLFSSCCDKNLSADISANVQPPTKNTRIVFGMSDCEISLVNESLRPLDVVMES